MHVLGFFSLLSGSGRMSWVLSPFFQVLDASLGFCTHLSGSGCIFGVLYASFRFCPLSFRFWTHDLEHGSIYITFLSGSGCGFWSTDWRLHLVEPGLCSACTGLCLQTQAAGEPLHAHQYLSDYVKLLETAEKSSENELT